MRALTEGTGFSRMTSYQEIVAHVVRDPTESPLIIERPRQAFGFPEIPGDPRDLAQREERLAKVKTKIDRVLELPARVWQMVQGR